MKSEDTGPYWVDASLESEEMEEQVWTAIQQCENVRMWALHEMTQRWTAALGSPKVSELVPAMTKFVRQEGYDIQRYTLLAALNTAVTDFNREVQVLGTDQGGMVHLVKFPNFQPNLEHFELVFQARSIWHKYMSEYGRISTVYGSIFLEGDWISTLQLQARSLGVSDEVFPFLVYSASLRGAMGGGAWAVRFNLHSPKSQIGKKKVRQKKAREQWQ